LESLYLNFKLKQIAGGASCLTRYEIIVGKLHICKQNDINLPQSKNHNL